jgi:hypothetical protein
LWGNVLSGRGFRVAASGLVGKKYSRKDFLLSSQIN